MCCTTRYYDIFLMLLHVLYIKIVTLISDVSSCTVQLDNGTYVCCFFMYCTTTYWHIFLRCRHVLYNYILAHISDVTSCTVQLDTGTYFWCVSCTVELGDPDGWMSYVVEYPNNSYNPITITACASALHCKFQKGYTLPMVCGSVWVLRLLPSLTRVVMILMKHCWKWG